LFWSVHLEIFISKSLGLYTDENDAPIDGPFLYQLITQVEKIMNGSNVVAACSKSPQNICRKPLEAILLVGLAESDVRLLLVKTAFLSALRVTLITAKQMISVLKPFCCRDSIDTIVILFYEHGRTYEPISLILARSADPKLLAQIKELSEQDQILLGQSPHILE
jgi:hypothetical protein